MSLSCFFPALVGLFVVRLVVLLDAWPVLIGLEPCLDEGAVLVLAVCFFLDPSPLLITLGCPPDTVEAVFLDTVLILFVSWRGILNGTHYKNLIMRNNSIGAKYKVQLGRTDVDPFASYHGWHQEVY